MYSWKIKAFAKGIDTLSAVEELNKIQLLHGKITPELIVNQSADADSILHPIFEWDNDKAGHLWRIQQARVLLNNIQVQVISDGEHKEISVYEVTTRDEGYKSIDTFDSRDVEFVRQSTIRQLTSLKEKLKIYKEFKTVIFYLDKAIESTS